MGAQDPGGNEKWQAKREGYLATVERLEPDIHPIDPSAFYASAAISLKRIADMLEKKWQYELRQQDEWLHRKGLGDLADKPK